MANTRQNTNVVDSIKGSYAGIIMPGLTVNDLKIPDSAPLTSITHATLASAEMAKPRQNLEAIEVNELDQLSKDILGKISQLKNFKTTASVGRDFALELESLEADKTKTVKDHQILLDQIYKTINVRHSNMITFFKQYDNQQMSSEMLITKIKQLKDPNQSNLITQTKNLIAHEKELERKLESLLEKATQELRTIPSDIKQAVNSRATP